jgi:hypothetical protein
VYKLRLLTPTEQFKIELRRYCGGSEDGSVGWQCEASGVGYHSAKLPTDRRISAESQYNGSVRGATAEEQAWEEWPKQCACGYQFADADPWQIWEERLFTLEDGTEVTLAEAPIGAAYYGDPEAFWLRHRASRQYEENHKGKRGLILFKYPTERGGDWFSPDWFWRGEEENPGHEGWAVSGTIEGGDLTVSPSVALGGGQYHGWVGINADRNGPVPPGFLSCDLDGKPY